VGHQGEVGPPPVQREQLQIVSGAYCELLRELCDFCNKNSPSSLCRQRETVRKWHTCGVHKVLFIEDDDAIRLALRLALEDEGYEVVEAHDGASGLVQFGQCQPDVVLLDLRLPDLSGFEVCKAMRSSSTVPIIMVTAQTEAADMVAGLEAGADDYVTKPVVPKVLSARIAAVLRRVSYESSGDQSHDEVVRFGDLELRREQGVVTKAGEELSLTRTEFRMLCEFAKHADAVLSRDQLLEHVWGYEYLGDSRLVDAHVRRLRLKIEDTPDEPQRIVTVRGLGYRLIS
jgi:DNA-binding response OmpR family regulator